MGFRPLPLDAIRATLQAPSRQENKRTPMYGRTGAVLVASKRFSVRGGVSALAVGLAVLATAVANSTSRLARPVMRTSSFPTASKKSTRSRVNSSMRRRIKGASCSASAQWTYQSSVRRQSESDAQRYWAARRTAIHVRPRVRMTIPNSRSTAAAACSSPRRQQHQPS